MSGHQQTVDEAIAAAMRLVRGAVRGPLANSPEGSHNAQVIDAALRRIAERGLAVARAEVLRDVWHRMNRATSGSQTHMGDFWEWLSEAADEAEAALAKGE